MKLVTVTPSYIDCEKRLQYASASVRSLIEAFGSRYEHIIINDVPRTINHCKAAMTNSPAGIYQAPSQVYCKNNMLLINRFGRGSASATLQAVILARKRGADLVFIHLDDNVYIPILNELIEYSIDAFARDYELMQIRMSGYPIIWKGNSRELGNTSQLEIHSDSIRFDNILLTPTRRRLYSAWTSDLSAIPAHGSFHPIILWSAVYRADFLESLLKFSWGLSPKSLGHIESYYKKRDGWYRTLGGIPWCRQCPRLSGKLGFINMQFGGLEMHRDKNWEELIQMSNTAIR